MMKKILQKPGILRKKIRSVYDLIRARPPQQLFAGAFVFVIIFITIHTFITKTPPSIVTNSALLVQTTQSKVLEITPTISLTAHTRANSLVTMRAEVAGRIIDVIKDKGQSVKAGELLLKFVNNGLLDKLEHARANVAFRQAAFQANTKLKAKSFVPQNTLLEAKANLEQAKADLANISYQVDQQAIRAPFDGYYEDRLVDKGDYVQAGDKLVTLVQLNPLKIKVGVQQSDISDLEIGKPATVKIAERSYVGKVDYVSKVADPKTRTYVVEVAIDNPDLKLADGLTAEVILEKRVVHAHKIKPSSLVINDIGEIGVRIVDPENKVHFHAIELIEAQQDYLIVTGLPEEVRLIVVGADFVKNGQIVQPVDIAKTL